MSDDQVVASYLAEVARHPVPAPAVQLAWARRIDAAQQAFNRAVLACPAACSSVLALVGAAPEPGAAPRWLARCVLPATDAVPCAPPTGGTAAEPPERRAQRLLEPLRLRCEFMAEVCGAVRATGVQDAATRRFLSAADQVQTTIRAATNRLVQANQRLVMSLARQYRYAPLAFMDLVQEGNLGLLRAIERFDPSHGARLSTYALWWVRRAMVYAIARQGHAVRPPVQLYWAARQLQRAINRLDGTACGSVLRAAAREFGTGVAEVHALLALLAPAATLHAPADGSEGGGRIERLAAPDAGDPEGSAMTDDLRRAVAALLDHLPPRHAKILRMRFGIGVHDDCTLEQIAQQQGVTRERIRQIEAQALEALRALEAAAALRACLT